jgi:hypothetical protein
MFWSNQQASDYPAALAEKQNYITGQFDSLLRRVMQIQSLDPIQ